MEVGPPDRPPLVADVVVVVVVPGVGIVEAAPKSVPSGLKSKMFPGAVVVVPGPVVPAPVVPVPLAGVEVFSTRLTKHSCASTPTSS